MSMTKSRKPGMVVAGVLILLYRVIRTGANVWQFTPNAGGNKTYKDGSEIIIGGEEYTISNIGRDNAPREKHEGFIPVKQQHYAGDLPFWLYNYFCETCEKIAYDGHRYRDHCGATYLCCPCCSQMAEYDIEYIKDGQYPYDDDDDD